MTDPYYHLSELQRELDGYERGADMMDRQMDKLIYENRALKAEIEELKLEILRLGAALRERLEAEHVHHYSGAGICVCESPADEWQIGDIYYGGTVTKDTLSASRRERCPDCGDERWIHIGGPDSVRCGSCNPGGSGLHDPEASQ